MESIPRITSKGEKPTVSSKDVNSTSSSSSDLQEYSNSSCTPGEQSLLLSRGLKGTNIGRTIPISYNIKAWMVSQPKPIPVLNKSMPPNFTTVAVLFFIGIQAFYMFYNISFSMSQLFVIADRASLLFAANLPLLYLLSAKNQPIKLLTGYSYESLNIFHRRLGEIMCLLAFLHSAGMVGVWYTILRPSGFTFIRYLLLKIVLLGLGAFLAYELLYLTSLGSFRQRWYEVFLSLHVSLQTTALILLWFHHGGSRPYVGIALAIFLIDRLVYRMTLKKKAVNATLEVSGDGATTILRARIPILYQPKWMKLLGLSVTSGWKATEHVFLTIPSLAQKHAIQAHPFTIASKAPLNADTDAKLELIVRAQRGFSDDLLRFALGHEKAAITLDGPYGSQSAVRMLQDCSVSVLIAGGSGIAVIWPLLWSILDCEKDKDVESMAMLEICKNILFIWIVRDAAHLAWLDARELEEVQPRGVKLVIPPPTSRSGHPDIEAIIRSWLLHHDSKSSGDFKTGVVCSGPDGLNRNVRNFCSSLLSEGWNVCIEIEKFGW